MGDTGRKRFMCRRMASGLFSKLVPGPYNESMFEILEHPADIGFRVFGGTLEELFANAAVAMVSIACEIEDVVPRIEYALSATGTDYESLLVNWLGEVLCWFDGKRIAPREFRVKHLAPDSIRAAAWGEFRVGEPAGDHALPARGVPAGFRRGRTAGFDL